MKERPQKRPSQDGPFCWQSAEAVERIRNDFEKHLAYALILYLTLTDVAREEGAATLKLRRRELAGRAGMSLRQLSLIMPQLRAIGVLDWQQTDRMGPDCGLNCYTLLRMYDGDVLERPPGHQVHDPMHHMHKVVCSKKHTDNAQLYR